MDIVSLDAGKPNEAVEKPPAYFGKSNLCVPEQNPGLSLTKLLQFSCSNAIFRSNSAQNGLYVLLGGFSTA
jgi:hypothetical protein